MGTEFSNRETALDKTKAELAASSIGGTRADAAYSMTSLRAGLNSADSAERVRSEHALREYVDVRDREFGLPESQCESAQTLLGYLTAEMKVKTLHAEKSMDVYPVMQGEQIVGGIQTVLQESRTYGKYAIHAELIGSLAGKLDIQLTALESLREIAKERGFECVILECNEDLARAIMHSESLSREARLSSYAYVQPSISDDPKEIDTSLFHVVLSAAKPVDEVTPRTDAIIAYYDHWAPGSQAQEIMQADPCIVQGKAAFRPLTDHYLAAEKAYKQLFKSENIVSDSALITAISRSPEGLLVKLKDGQIVEVKNEFYQYSDSTNFIAVRGSSITVGHNHFGERRNFVYSKTFYFGSDGSCEMQYNQQFSGAPAKSTLDRVKATPNATIFELDTNGELRLIGKNT